MSADPLARVLRIGGLAAAALLVVGAAVGTLLAGRAGLWGGLLGALVPAVFLGITAAVGVSKVPVARLGVLVLASWLLKIVALIAFLAWLREQDWFSRPIFFAFLLVGTAGLLTLEGWLVTRSPQLYADPSADGPRD